MRLRYRILTVLILFFTSLIILAHTQFFYSFEWKMLRDDFAQAFWPNFLSDAIVTLLFAVYLNYVLERAIHSDYSVDIELPTTINGDRHVMIRPEILNNGQETFKDREIRWNLYVEIAAIEFAYDYIELNRGQLQLSNINYRHYQGYISEPLFPGEQTPLPPIHLQKTAAHSTTRVYYYFATIQGLFPRQTRMGSDAKVVLDSLKSIEVELPKKNKSEV